MAGAALRGGILGRMDAASLVTGMVIGAAAVGALAWWLARRLAAAEDETARLRARELETAAERGRLQALAAEAQAAGAARSEAARLAAELAEARARLEAASADAARRAGDDAAREAEAAQARERLRLGLDGVLTPLRERLKEFEDKVARANEQENRDRAAILEALRRVDLSQARLNQEAATLARALSGESKVQGDWGEMILENLLQGAGLQEGREYAVQQQVAGEDGARLRPDVVVWLPDGKAVVVDSKVSLSAFLAATAADDPAVRDTALDAHRASLRQHVKDLAGKSYQELVGDRRLDFTVLFVPSEPAFHAAMARDPALYADAMRQGVVLASPTTLLATLRVVALVWSHERHNANAQRIAEEAGRLLDKLAGFVEDLDGVGERLQQARDAWESARAKLSTGRGNLLGRAQKLHELGARLGKTSTAEVLGLGGDTASAGE